MTIVEYGMIINVTEHWNMTQQLISSEIITHAINQSYNLLKDSCLLVKSIII